MPNHWLLKTEPSVYSFDHLVKDGRTVWDGVKNNLALMHLRAMKAGDKVLIYHSGAAKEVVGYGRILKGPYPDPKLDDAKLVVVDIAPDARLSHPVSLAAIKADPVFADFALVRMSRLSVMPVTPEQWKRLQTLEQRP